MASDQADQPAGSQRRLLADYVLAENDGPLFLIGCQPSDIYWPQARVNAHEVIELESFSDVQAGLSNVDEAVRDTCCAVLNIQKIESNLEPLIGSAVRSFPNRLIVYTLLNQASDALFFSFGFKKLNVLGDSDSGQRYQWYEFRLSHYKQPPDWLNSRFWANPERFELDDDEELDGDEEE